MSSGSDRINTLLWELIKYSSIEDDLNVKCSIAEELILEDIEFDRRFDSLLSEFVTNSNGENLIKLRLFAINYDKYITTSQRIRLLANFVLLNIIDQKKAAEIIASFSFEQRKSLKSDEIELIEIAEIVWEDYTEGFIEVDEDSVFIEKLEMFADLKK